MSNKYCQALVELRNKPAHELKEVGDGWRAPDNIFWGINTLSLVCLDLFTDGDNAKCAAYYTAEDNALAHDWSERLAELKGAAFGNPHTAAPVSMRGGAAAGMRYIMKHASAMRDKGGRYVFLIKNCHQRSVVAGRRRAICFLFAGVLVLNFLPGLSRRMRSRCRQALSSLVLLLFRQDLEGTGNQLHRAR
ncbi:phage N-6-adenine-methyltransferase [Escherichia coli]